MRMDNCVLLQYRMAKDYTDFKYVYPRTMDKFCIAFIVMTLCEVPVRFDTDGCVTSCKCTVWHKELMPCLSLVWRQSKAGSYHHLLRTQSCLIMLCLIWSILQTGRVAKS